MITNFAFPSPKSGYVCYCAKEMDGIAEQTKLFFEQRTKLPFDLLKVKWGEFDDGTR
jgi:hypothetical protein